ncbi:MAG: tRNA (cytidine(34)-2'-O)-methyltransferase [Epulopiscium sp.]|jgi:tRNA (cytidine/uridine-2'-O-)-methyltransferase|nr:tRNA (cytidine(34)-2'-O)-methyltransferase [Candidatus Epulonipiscium sp.]HOQ16577.1 tRNA (cytidine(34)-2'-O)-methyltransferase [Defluviitaleaceae bacterium]HPT75911.1 tRNA (cytidine(34)-2'-O)-methyltransferase [Defluviitaleaceae bacterium]
MNIVLLEPEIPQNTGNIARTCAAIGADLHLIKPLGFSIDDKHLKRAGLDYWHLLNVYYYENFEDFKSKHPDGLYFMATTKAQKVYTEVKYTKDCFIIFGKETAGIPESILIDYPETCIRIPMREEARSLNLSNSVAIVAYEAMRQLNFEGLLKEGELRDYKWNEIPGK